MKTLKKLFSVSAIVALLGTLAPMYAFGAGNSLDLDPEFPQAYAYAYANGITTQSEDNADMGGKLTRIALAKMIAKYAINVLKLTPDTSKTCNFTDVTAALDAQYDNGVTQACQLGLMGVNITAFRPNDLVTRGEFGTTFSRALNADSDNLAAMNAANPYYKEHLNYLNKEGIMKVIDPNMLEVRGYVMLMMMRSDDSYEPSTAEGCSAEELLACFNADDYDACIAACSDEEPTEEEEPTYQENKSGILTAKISSDTPNAEVPANIERVPFLTFNINADEDITLHSATFEFEGYGDPTKLINFSIYNSNNVKVSKEKESMTNGKVTISFLSNTVVKAKETFTVVAKINGADNSTYGLRLTSLNTSAETTKGLPVIGNSMRNVGVVNMGVLDFVSMSGSTETPVKVGEDALLAKFKLSNTGKIEDVLVKSIIIDVNTNNGNFENLSLYANDEEIANNLKVNGKQIVANIDYTVAKNTRNVEFELRGSATEMANGILFSMDKDAILANGEKYGFTTAINGLTDDTSVSRALTIGGSDVTVSFTKSDIDEAKKGTEGVYIGTLKFTSKGNYTINKIYVNATADTGIIDDIRLGDMSDDKYVAGRGYEFTDIDLVAGNTLSLPLVFDINENAKDGSGVDFAITLTTAEFEDTDNDETYTYGGTNKLEDIVSTIEPLATKEITVSAASLSVKVMTLTDRVIALGGENYELAYKARLDAGDAGDVEISKIVLTNNGVIENTTSHTTGKDLGNVVSSVKLEIDGTEYTSSKISANTVTFTNLKKTIVAGASNVDLKVSVQTKSVDNYSGTIQLTIAARSDIIAKDGSEDVVPTLVPGTQTVLRLATAGTLTATFDTTENTSTTMNNFTKQPKFALAGSEDSVLLAKVKLVANVEDIRITDVVLTGNDTAGTFESSIDTISLVYGDQTIAGKTVNAAGKTVVTFDKLTSKKLDVSSDTPSYLEIRATFKAINTKSAEGGATDGANLTGILVGFTAKGLSSQDELMATTPSSSNGITVVANTIDSITLTPADNLEAGSNVLVGTLTVKPTAQDWNINSAGDVINAHLSKLKLTSSSVALSGDAPVLTIKRDGTTGAASGDSLTPAEWNEIDGETVFEIYADNIEIKDTANKTASLTIKIDDITTDVVFGNVTKLLPTGATKSISVKVSE